MTLILDPTAYRLAPKQNEQYYGLTIPTGPITRENIDTHLDNGHIETLMTNGHWWRIRRNGRTQTWKRNPLRIRIPFKMGLYGHGAISENDFIDTTTAR